MKVAIIGSALSGNKGAAAMLESSIQNISKIRPDTEFTLLSLYPKRDAKLNVFDNLKVVDSSPVMLGLVINPLALAYRILPPLRRSLVRNKGLKAFVEADILLDQSGITFVDGRSKFLVYNIATILPALLVKTPVFKCAQALGPFKSGLNRTMAKIFLPKVSKIISRGSATHSYLTGLGLTNVVKGADYAFALRIDLDELNEFKSDPELGLLGSKRNKLVGISPSIVVAKKLHNSGIDYSQCLADFIDYLISKKYDVVLLAHSAIQGSVKSHNNDLILCRMIKNKVSIKSGCYFVDKEISSQRLRYIIGRCDIFVASRFHAMVSSLSMEVPTLVIGWSHKYKEVLEMFGLEKYAFGYNDLTLKELTRQFNQLEQNIVDVKILLKKRLPVVKSLANEQTKLIIEIAEKK